MGEAGRQAGESTGPVPVFGTSVQVQTVLPQALGQGLGPLVPLPDPGAADLLARVPSAVTVTVAPVSGGPRLEEV